MKILISVSLWLVASACFFVSCHKEQSVPQLAWGEILCLVGPGFCLSGAAFHRFSRKAFSGRLCPIRLIDGAGHLSQWENLATGFVGRGSLYI